MATEAYLVTDLFCGAGGSSTGAKKAIAEIGGTMEEVLYRYGRLKNAGCKPYPMVYDQSNRLLKAFQRWVVGRFDEVVSWDKYQPAQKLRADTGRGMVIHGSSGGLEFSKDW